MTNTVAIRADKRPNGRYDRRFDDLILAGKLQGKDVLHKLSTHTCMKLKLNDFNKCTKNSNLKLYKET